MLPIFNITITFATFPAGYCSGVDLTWNTFDEAQVSSDRYGTFVLAKDSKANDFQVTIDKQLCDTLICVTYVELTDNIGGHSARITKDMTVSIFHT